MQFQQTERYYNQLEHGGLENLLLYLIVYCRFSGILSCNNGSFYKMIGIVPTEGPNSRNCGEKGV
jgi:hypothetical protein